MSTIELLRITPVEPPKVNINKKIVIKKEVVVLICNMEELVFKYVHNQLNILLPVGKDIIIVTTVK